MAKFHGTYAWKKARRIARIEASHCCSRCGKHMPIGLHVHHQIPVSKTLAVAFEPLNLSTACPECHNRIEPRVSNATQRANRTRPILPKPGCRVMLVCGPPGAGKSSYVQAHKGPGDSVIEFDAIAAELGFTRQRGSLSHAHVGMVLDERNERLRALARAPADHTAWVVLNAPSSSLRAWWCQQLHVAPDDMVLLKPARDELERRIRADPNRASKIDLHTRLLDQWFERERANDVGVIAKGCDEFGNPVDPLHPWARLAKAT
jgi:predicted kinase